MAAATGLGLVESEAEAVTVRATQVRAAAETRVEAAKEVATLEAAAVARGLTLASPAETLVGAARDAARGAEAMAAEAMAAARAAAVTTAVG